eukprot:SAG11_NODE_822_length_7009_cov_7.776122_7_plen_118_part_00
MLFGAVRTACAFLRRSAARSTALHRGNPGAPHRVAKEDGVPVLRGEVLDGGELQPARFDSIANSAEVVRFPVALTFRDHLTRFVGENYVCDAKLACEGEVSAGEAGDCGGIATEPQR